MVAVQVKEPELPPLPTQAAGPGEFIFSFVKSGALGINAKDARFEISANHPCGIVDMRNKELPPDQQLRIGDKILAVNGKYDESRAMLKQVADFPQGQEVVLTCVRPQAAAPPPTDAPAADFIFSFVKGATLGINVVNARFE